ncbi:hypothetical protein PJN38_24345 [Mycobacterium kansasii]
MNETVIDYLRRCPVCWRNVPQTMRGNITRHWDSIGRDMSNQPYGLMEIGRSQRHNGRRISRAGAA